MGGGNGHAINSKNRRVRREKRKSTRSAETVQLLGVSRVLSCPRSSHAGSARRVKPGSLRVWELGGYVSLQALVYYILPPATAIIGYTIGIKKKKLSANRCFFPSLGDEMAIGFLDVL